jgi:RNA polymerase sigma factor (sigma-70 family)
MPDAGTIEQPGNLPSAGATIWVMGERAAEPAATGGEREDAALVRLARAGDRAAFGTLLSRHWELLLALCRRTLGDAELARDAAQEAALQALLGLDRLRHAASFGPWLAGIGLNVCRSWRRYRPRDAWSWEALLGGRAVQEPVDWRPDPAERAEAADLAARVLRAVADLPPGQRSAVLLFYLGGLTHAETAAQLGIDVGAVKTRLHKGRATLRRRLLSLWEEESMTVSGAPDKTGQQPIEMRVVDVRRTPGDDERPPRHVVVLEEVGGPRSLHFWVGGFEGMSLALQLEKAESTRPLTYAFLASVLEAAGSLLKEARIVRLAEETFYASAVVESAAGTRRVDARPSDAVSLALLTGAPILVEPAVLAAVERQPPRADIPPEERNIAGLRQRSIGSAEIVGELREGWRREGWRGWKRPAE